MSYFSQHPRAQEALSILERQDQWSPALETLIDRYSDTPDELQAVLKEQVEEALIDVASLMSRMPDAPVSRLMARRLSAMECFYSRAIKEGDKGSDYWNPLEESYSDFKHKGCDVHFYQASEAFPASDIISKWSQEHLQ